MLRALPACVGVLAVSGIMMMFYCWRVTGNPLQLPYTLDRATYAVAPLFIGQKPSPPKVYRHAVMKKFYLEWEPSFEEADSYNSLTGFIKGVLLRAEVAGQTLLGRTDVYYRFDPFAVIFGALVQRYIQPHYLAPLLAIAVALKMMCVRHLYCLRWKGKRIGMALAPVLIAAALADALSGYGFMGYLTHHEVPQQEFVLKRDAVIRKLRQVPGRHLVLVRYSNDHNVHEEWAYNSADIDASDIVWAREMSEEQNQNLAAYFSGRSIWLLAPDSNEPVLHRQR
jgi:hypothetical protein